MDGKKLARISPFGRQSSTVDRQILALVDSVIVGRLGTTELAGLSLASTLLVTVVGLCVFLAYATTAVVARRLGAGDRAGALQVGVDGVAVHPPEVPLSGADAARAALDAYAPLLAAPTQEV